MLLSMLGSVAKFEQSLILKHQREDIAIAKKKGVHKERKPKLSDEDAAKLGSDHTAGVTVTELARRYDMSRATVYNYMKA